MAVSLGFGTNNLIFVPEGQMLRIHDLYHGRLIALDVRRSAVAFRQHALEQLEVRIEEQMQKGGAKKNSESGTTRRDATTRFVHSVREIGVEHPAPMRPEQVAPTHLTLWVRITDEPGESFFAEDYDDVDEPAHPSALLPIYGTCLIEEAAGMEVSFPQSGPAAAFELHVPVEGGIVLEDLDPLSPLPLVHEFCGIEGVAARGDCVNMSFGGEVLGNHLGCVPLRRVGSTAFATLYFSQGYEIEHRLTALLPGRLVKVLADLLAASGFKKVAVDEKYALFVRGDVNRDADVVHIYRKLEGKESEGVRIIPPFAYVAMAAGSADPAMRGAFLETLVETINKD